MYTTYVGSFPLDYNRENIERIMRDVSTISIDYPCYPQLMDFVAQFLEPLVKANILVKRPWGYLLISEVKVSVDVSDAERQALIAVDYVKASGLSKYFKGLRACVTGPFTLASRIYLKEPPSPSNTLLAQLEYLEPLVNYLRRIIRDFLDMGYKYINVDDPYLSVMVGARAILHGCSPDDIMDLLDKLARSIPSISGIHVCGRISPHLAELLVQSYFSILDHEFVDSPANFNSYTRDMLEDYDKFLGVGVVSSKFAAVEDLSKAISILERAIKRYGLERVRMVKPDCGFRGLRGAQRTVELAYSIALRKLKVVKEARDIIASKYGLEVE